MELRGLEYFVAVAEEQSFTRAAQRCFVTQPTISAQIQALERELGEPLFDRAQRGAVLTDGGSLLLPYARQCLRAAEDAKSEFSARAGLLRGELRIGTGGGVEYTTIPTLLGELRMKYPGIDIDVAEAPSKPLLDMVLQGRLHAAVIAAPSDDLPPTISSAKMFGERIVAVFDPTVHPLPDNVQPTLAAVAEYPIISYPRTSALRARIEAAATETGASIQVNYAANDVRLQVAFVQQGLGIALSVRSDPALKDCGLTVRDTSPVIEFEKILVWRNDIAEPAPLRAFFEMWANMTAAADPSGAAS
ncbi:LysR family transcriptional regulator [Mycolicibacterium fluoranthenivorans]|uniref:Probable hydrogen peroxide-inducible genes activator n=1 Tax=Mycolicibacterium fluoranthenivorans TaxID=258505 RepID=A0A7X5U5L6_9MYCO|nr:LysR family transcriptional regulator [Mycolicibacterium fluoranthenivorans]MCV7354665.1 LysR family transcriptional regulator [Mycolicibacterium fluoranthenivorans]NIH98745.1 DNA-binding transcriptional LysR family regulator [Mycolicibacterium fluoranthenivorans]